MALLPQVLLSWFNTACHNREERQYGAMAKGMVKKGVKLSLSDDVEVLTAKPDPAQLLFIK
jgi:hypothetical protein